MVMYSICFAFLLAAINVHELKTQSIALFCVCVCDKSKYRNIRLISVPFVTKEKNYVINSRKERSLRSLPECRHVAITFLALARASNVMVGCSWLTTSSVHTQRTYAISTLCVNVLNANDATTTGRDRKQKIARAKTTKTSIRRERARKKKCVFASFISQENPSAKKTRSKANAVKKNVLKETLSDSFCPLVCRRIYHLILGGYPRLTRTKG